MVPYTSPDGIRIPTGNWLAISQASVMRDREGLAARLVLRGVPDSHIQAMTSHSGEQSEIRGTYTSLYPPGSVIIYNIHAPQSALCPFPQEMTLADMNRLPLAPQASTSP